MDKQYRCIVPLTCIIDETGGVVDATPESMGHNILLSAKMTLNARINMF